LNAEEYFGMIINILMGLTLIMLVLIFLYMIYGEKEERSSPSTRKVTLKILGHISTGLERLYLFL